MESIYSPSEWTFRNRKYLGTNHLNYGFWSTESKSISISGNYTTSNSSSSISSSNLNPNIIYHNSHVELLNQLLEHSNITVHVSLMRYMNSFPKSILFIACGCGHEIEIFCNSILTHLKKSTRSDYKLCNSILTHLKKSTRSDYMRIRIVGVELVQEQVEIARSLLCNRPEYDGIFEIVIIQGNACELDQLGLSMSADQNFDLIICMDSAYHFNTRLAFFNQSKHILTGGGTLSMVDFCFEWSNQTLLAPLLSRLLSSSIPLENQISISKYTTQLSNDAGFSNVRLKDISRNVFPGFKHHVISCFKRRSDSFIGWIPLLCIAYFMEWLSIRTNVLKCVLVSAQS